ncbi:hypothetical protein Ssi03_11970 [Sphaerisporangium siamense]|nr:hypothetical protein Ssi03_11970 [Sphaerisporangium siamense]
MAWNNVADTVSGHTTVCAARAAHNGHRLVSAASDTGTTAATPATGTSARVSKTR